MMNAILYHQLALDFCCTEDDVRDRENHFTVYTPREGRRRFDRTEDDCFLKIAVVGGKLLVSGREEIVRKLENTYRDENGAWFFEYPTLRRLDELCLEFGYRVYSAHPFFISDTTSPLPAQPAEEYDTVLYEGSEIEQFRGDNRFDEAFGFHALAPDVLGIAAVRRSDGEILGMAGASADSPFFWQIGINVIPSARRCGIASDLVARLKNEILARGILPYYGTSPSHLISQSVALNAGFRPAWTELITERIPRDE